MLHKISKLFICYLAITMASGCMKVKKKSEQAEDKPDAPAVEIQSTKIQSFDFDYELDEGMQKVRFKIPESWPELVVVEKVVGKEKAVIREITFPQQIWKDLLVNDTKTSYKFYEKTEKDLRLIDQVDVIPVLDLDLQKDFQLEDFFGSLALVRKIQIRNLEIKNSAHLFIGDYKGLVRIENLQSDKGVIQTFSEGSRASQGDGRSVGDFNLQILNGTGELNVHLFAEAGANGLPGKDPDAALTGASGAEGESAQFAVASVTSCLGIGTDMCFPSEIYKCTKPPGKGGEAQDGLQGYQGQSGFNGGSVKKISLENLSSALQVNIYKKAGRKGNGGPGGLGGRPGEPGKGGDGGNKAFMKFFKVNPDDPQSMGKLFGRVLGEACAEGATGKAGARGPQGFSGADGEDGMIF